MTERPHYYTCNSSCTLHTNDAHGVVVDSPADGERSPPLGALDHGNRKPFLRPRLVLGTTPGITNKRQNSGVKELPP